MKYIASVRDPETNAIVIIKRDYPTKKQLAEDLRNNGYRVRVISTEDKFDEDCEKYYDRLRKNAEKQQMKRDSRRLGRYLGKILLPH